MTALEGMSHRKTPRVDVQESMKTKLFNPQSAEGEPNYRAINEARAFTESLSKHPWFIGVTLHGSQLQGYSNEFSDTDLAVFYDSSHQNEDAELPVQTTLKLSSEFRDNGKKVEVTTYDLKPDAVDKLIKQYGSFHLPWDGTPNGLGKLCFPAASEKIQKYRAAVGEKLRALPEKERGKVIAAIVDELSKWEKSRFGRMKERIDSLQNVSRREKSEIFDERRTLIDQRVHRIFGI